jgi:DNA-binding phage protein
MATKKSKPQERHWVGAKKTKQDWRNKTWKQIGKFADAALQAVDTGRVQHARELLNAIRGVALTAEKDQL